MESTKQALLKKAAELMGRDELAVRLKVPQSLLDSWIRGLATMPDRKLVLLTDILNKSDRDE